MNGTKTYLLFETEYWSVYLGFCQRYLGRSIVKLKRDCGDLADISENELLDFLQIVKRLEATLRRTFGATMFNWTCLMNNAYQSENPNPKVHWHFRPRYRDPVLFQGKTFYDKEFGHHYVRDEEDRNEQTKMLEKIANKLSLELNQLN